MKLLLFGDDTVLNVKPFATGDYVLHVKAHKGHTSLDMLEGADFGLHVYIEEDTYDACVIVAGARDIENKTTINDLINNLAALVNIAKTRVPFVWVAQLHYRPTLNSILHDRLGDLVLSGCYSSHKKIEHVQHLLQIQAQWEYRSRLKS